MRPIGVVVSAKASAFLTLVLLAAPLAWTVLRDPSVWDPGWLVAALLVGGTSIVYWLVTPTQLIAPAPPRVLRWAMPAFVAYVCIQLVPLPRWALAVLSPERAHFLLSLEPVVGTQKWAPLSFYPAATQVMLLTCVTCLLLFLLVRELTFRFRMSSWISVLPVAIVGIAEAALGLVQSFGPTDAFATGTYSNRDHYAGFLEMVLPLVLMASARTNTFNRVERRVGAKLIAALPFLVITLLIIAIVRSRSKMGTAIAVSVLVWGILLILSNRPHATRSRGRFAVAGVVILAVALLTPRQVVDRFLQKGKFESDSTRFRLSFWSSSLSMIREFLTVGCGLGTFESAFFRHQRAATAFRIEYAHNDYLNCLVELGLVGFAIVVVGFYGVAAQLIRTLRASRRAQHRNLAVGCTGSVAAILLHSFVDFNLYVPANAMVFAWILGIGSAISLLPKEQPELVHDNE